MIMYIHFWLAVLTCIPWFTKSQHLIDIKLITSYVQKQEFPTKVVFCTCWSKTSKLKVLEQTSKSNIFATVMTNFSKITEITPSPDILIVSDSVCEEFNFLLSTAAHLKLLRAPTKWLILNNHTDNHISSGTELFVDSNFAVATKISDKSYHLKLLYKRAPNDRHFQYNDLGIFSEERGFRYYNQFLVSRNRSDLKGSNVTAGYVITQPDYFIDGFDYRHRHADTTCKLSYLLYIHLFEMLNSSKSVIQRDSWGYKAPNATLYDDGMFADVQNGSIEIACAAFYLIERLSIVEYIAVDSPSDVKFILKHPPLSHVHNVFMLSFGQNVWYSLYSVFGLAVMILYTIVACESKFFKTLHKGSTLHDIRPNFFDVVMVQVGVVTQQGSDTEPKTYSGRISLFITLLIMMFLYTAYAANIVVFLQSTSDSIKTVSDLLYSNIEVGVDDTVYNRYYFQNQHEPIRKALYEKKIAVKGQKPHFMDAAEGVKRMRANFFAFNVESSAGYKEVIETFQEHEKCGLTEIDYLNALWPSISIRRNSPYKELIKVGFRKMHDSGIIHCQKNRLYFTKPRCAGHGGSFVNVGLIEVYFPFMLFGVGILLAVCLLLAELFSEKYKHSAIEKWNNQQKHN